MTLDTVVIPAAGLGTRMLPATKSVPKELLPVYDTPLMHFALSEAVAAGARKIVVISHPSKPALEAYLRPSDRLERALEDDDKQVQLDALRDLTFEDVEIEIVYQEKALGLGHAVLQAAPCVKGARFGVILPDDLLLSGRCLSDMSAAYADAGCTNLVGAMDVPDADVSKYGIFDLAETGTGGTVPVHGMVEKPEPKDAPSNLAALGRYILSSDIFDVLETTTKGAGGEIQLTDAISSMSDLHAFRVTERRFDCGTKEGLFEASTAVRDGRETAKKTLTIAAE